MQKNKKNGKIKTGGEGEKELMEVGVPEIVV